MTRIGNRRAAPVGVLVGLAAVPAVVLAGLWQYADAEVPPATTTTTTTMPPPSAPPLTTDLLSYRRHPTPLAEQAAAEAAAAANAARVATLLDVVGDGSCVRIVDDDTVVAEEGGGVSVIPASNQKLFIAATALEVLGPDFRFRTELQSAPPVGGVVPGGVYLVGGGDPVLTTALVADPQRYPAFNTTALETLADQLVALGITTIDGDVVGDGSRYDDEFRVDAWGDDITSLDAGPYDALLVNDGIISPGNYGLDPSRAAARRVLRPADRTRHHRHRCRRQRSAPGRRRPHHVGADRIASADRRARGDAPHQRQQHRRDAGEGNRVRDRRAGHTPSRARHRSGDARTMGRAPHRCRPPRRVRSRSRRIARLARR